MSNDLKSVKRIVKYISTIGKRRPIAIVYKIKNKRNKRFSSKFTNSIRNTIPVKLSNALRKLF